jgi:CRISPR/Cas system-associated protein Cas5 (RAMP superfamily)
MENLQSDINTLAQVSTFVTIATAIAFAVVFTKYAALRRRLNDFRDDIAEIRRELLKTIRIGNDLNAVNHDRIVRLEEAIKSKPKSKTAE